MQFSKETLTERLIALEGLVRDLQTEGEAKDERIDSLESRCGTMENDILTLDGNVQSVVDDLASVEATADRLEAASA